MPQVEISANSVQPPPPEDAVLRMSCLHRRDQLTTREESQPSQRTGAHGAAAADNDELPKLLPLSKNEMKPDRIPRLWDPGATPYGLKERKMRQQQRDLHLMGLKQDENATVRYSQQPLSGIGHLLRAEDAASENEQRRPAKAQDVPEAELREKAPGRVRAHIAPTHENVKRDMERLWEAAFGRNRPDTANGDDCLTNGVARDGCDGNRQKMQVSAGCNIPVRE